MGLAGRLAIEGGAPVCAVGHPGERARALGYHGIDILVRMLNAHGFEAETREQLPEGAQVRLRLPGLGAAHARILSSEDGRLHARFANPIGEGRLSRIPGLSRLSIDRAA